MKKKTIKRLKDLLEMSIEDWPHQAIINGQSVEMLVEIMKGSARKPDLVLSPNGNVIATWGDEYKYVSAELIPATAVRLVCRTETSHIASTINDLELRSWLKARGLECIVYKC